MLKETKAESVVALEQISISEDIQNLVKIISENAERYIGKRNFAGQLDIEGILKTLPKCSAKVIGNLRGELLSLYRSANIAEFLAGDKSALLMLKEGIDDLLKGNSINDKIKKLQLKWFKENLEEIISRLN